MNTKLTLVVVVCALLASACDKPTDAVAPVVFVADAIYVGGDIITVNYAQPTVEAVAVKDGRILALGARSEIEKTYKGPATSVVDLGAAGNFPLLRDEFTL